MTLDQPTIKALALQSLIDPRKAARGIVALDGGLALALLATGAVACISALFSVLLGLWAPPTGNPLMEDLLHRPFVLAGFQLAGMVMFAGLVTGVGRIFGGTGRLGPALLLFAWVNFLMLLAQLALLLVVLALPGLGALLFLVLVAGSVWILACFIAELHGFLATLPTLCALIGTLILLVLLLGASAPPM